MHPSRPRRTRIRIAALGLLVAAAGGCDGRPAMDASRTEAKVSGVVKIRGKVAEGGGQISFDPSNAERQVGAIVAQVNADGTYSAKSFTGDNIVRFSGPMIKATPEVALGSRFCTLQAGDNTVDFDLLGDTDKPRGSTYTRKKAGR